MRSLPTYWECPKCHTHIKKPFEVVLFELGKSDENPNETVKCQSCGATYSTHELQKD